MPIAAFFFFFISSFPEWQLPDSKRLGDTGTPLPVHTTHIADLHRFSLYRCRWKAEILILLISHNIPLNFCLSNDISERHIIRGFFLYNITVFLHKSAMCLTVPVHIAACLPNVRAGWFLPLTFSSAKKNPSHFLGCGFPNSIFSMHFILTIPSVFSRQVAYFQIVSYILGGICFSYLSLHRSWKSPVRHLNTIIIVPLVRIHLLISLPT